jgi:uncharacterized protein (TIGR03435 family)
MSGLFCKRLAQLVVLSAGLLSTNAYVSAQGLGQTAESPPAFEVASVKLSTGSPRNFKAGPSQVEWRNYTLHILIIIAYGVGYTALSGPDWLDSVNLDVVAKMPASAARLSPEEQRRMTAVMLQGLLAERFKLKVHQEEKVVPGYALVVGPGGPKMRRVEPLQFNMGVTSVGSIIARSLPVAQIVASAGGALGMPVRDMTGLSGYYEFNLTWTPEDKVLTAADNTSTAPDDPSPSIFTALQEQLGLRLEPRKFPIQTVVVDHVERVPTEN